MFYFRIEGLQEVVSCVTVTHNIPLTWGPLHVRGMLHVTVI